MKEIPLSKGYVALVDDEDYEELMRYKWHVGSYGPRPHAMRKVRPAEGETVTRIAMHRQITGAPKGMDVDHINHQTLDNQRANLRVCTRSQNMMNMRKRPGCSSRFKGVCWNKANDNWIAYIMVNYCQKTIGYFDDEVDAARAYNAEARVKFREFALLNDA